MSWLNGGFDNMHSLAQVGEFLEAVHALGGALGWSDLTEDGPGLGVDEDFPLLGGVGAKGKAVVAEDALIPLAIPGVFVDTAGEFGVVGTAFGGVVGFADAVGQFRHLEQAVAELLCDHDTFASAGVAAWGKTVIPISRPQIAQTVNAGVVDRPMQCPAKESAGVKKSSRCPVAATNASCCWTQRKPRRSRSGDLLS